MTPPHGTRHELSDTGEREAHRKCATVEEAELLVMQHEGNCREKGPIKDLRNDVIDLGKSFADMTATIRTYGKAVAGAVALLTLAVAMLGLLQMRDKPERHSQAAAPALVQSAQAATGR